MLGKLFRSKSKEEKFWDWFSKNDDPYFRLEGNLETIFDQLKNKLNELDENLTFEFGPVRDNGKREFIISADGIKSAFPVVVNLVQNAPELQRWMIIPFRQPKQGLTHIKYRNIQLDFADVFFRYAEDNGKIGIELNIRNYDEEGDWMAIIFLMLDTVLGEYDTEMGLSWIERKKLDEADISNLHPITDLPAIMRKYKMEREN